MSDYVRTSGPLFDGRAESALDRAVRAIRNKIADEGERIVREQFAGSIRDDQGHFLGSITAIEESRAFTTTSGRKSYTMEVTVDSATEEAVTSDLATYGPWLEGTGSRNDTTRFKGYHGFRQATQELDRRATDLADQAMRPFVEEMNR